MSVFELSGLQKLRRVGLVRVNNLTDQAIYSLADRHSTLERIHLSYCDQITVMAIHFLLQKLPKLTHLSLTGVPAFRRSELQQWCRDPPPVSQSVVCSQLLIDVKNRNLIQVNVQHSACILAKVYQTCENISPSCSTPSRTKYLAKTIPSMTTMQRMDILSTIRSKWTSLTMMTMTTTTMNTTMNHKPRSIRAHQADSPPLHLHKFRRPSHTMSRHI